MYVTTHSDQTDSNLNAVVNRQPNEEGAEREKRRRKETNNAVQARPP